MRLIGTLDDEASTKKLIAFLLTEEIKAVAEKGETSWEIWIKNEDDVKQSKAYLTEFIKNPSDARYDKAVEKANQLAREELEKQEKNRQNLIVMRKNWSGNRAQRKPLVVTLIVISIAVFMTTKGWEYRGMLGGTASSPNPTPVLKALLFVDPDDARAEVLRRVTDELGELQISSNDLADVEEVTKRITAESSRLQRAAADENDVKLLNIKQGQFWRLFTPMFIHFGFLHILFNMLWLHSLGGQFEDKLGTFRFGIFVLTAAVVAQVVQQMMPATMQGSSALTLTGGMSGVNFALGGFLWMKTLYEPQSGFSLSPVAMFTLILVLIVGIFDGGNSVSMANWAHGAGFVFGLLCGYLPILRVTPRSR